MEFIIEGLGIVAIFVVGVVLAVEMVNAINRNKNR